MRVMEKTAPAEKMMPLSEKREAPSKKEHVLCFAYDVRFRNHIYTERDNFLRMPVTSF